MTMPSGERLGGAYIYFSAHGVLAEPESGLPRPGGGDQSALLGLPARLLGAAARTARPDPDAWVRAAGADRELRERGTLVFGQEGWVLPQTDFLPYVDESAELRLYDDLPPLGDSLPPEA